MPTPNEFSRIDFGRSQPAQDAPEASQFGPFPGRIWFLLETRSDAQFTSDKSNTPGAMASETDNSQSAFASLQEFLNNNLQTAVRRVRNDQNKPWTPPHGE